MGVGVGVGVGWSGMDCTNRSGVDNVECGVWSGEWSVEFGRVEWSGVEWSGVEWSGVENGVKSGVERSGEEWSEV